MILRAAADELSLVTSVEDFTINLVARRVGLAKGTVYLYYKSKSALLLELLGDAVETLAIDMGTKFGKLPEPVTAKQAPSATARESDQSSGEVALASSGTVRA